MDIKTKKLNLIEWISRLNDNSIIEKIQKIKEGYVHSRDWSDELKKEEIESINRGLKDFEDGRTHDNQVARNIYEKYL